MELIPKPNGRFLKIKCPDCESEQVVYTRGSISVKCNKCGYLLAEPTGGKMEIHGEIVEYVDKLCDFF